MISSRVGAALALFLAVAALAIAIVAFMSTVRSDGDTIGRLVQTRRYNNSADPPVLFTVDDFFAGTGSDGRVTALYVYPPGYDGHVRGCKVVWDSAATADTADGRQGPGLYVDPCNGARFDRDGAFIAGEADRGLDRFPTQPGVDGVVVDTRRLICGKDVPSIATPASGETPTATVAARERTCDRVSPNTKKP